MNHSKRYDFNQNTFLSEHPFKWVLSTSLVGELEVQEKAIKLITAIL